MGVAAGAPWLAPDDPTRTDWRQIRKAPTWAHPFGTDDLGRDNLSRVDLGQPDIHAAASWRSSSPWRSGVPSG